MINKPTGLPKPPVPDQGSITQALFDFQSRFPGVEKKRKNPFTQSMYASYDDIMVAAKPLLIELQIVVIDVTNVMQQPNGDVTSILTCRLLHMPSNTVIESSLPLPSISDGAQVLGSFMTYWKRYLFCGLVGIVEAADDDGTATMPVANGPARLTEKQHSEILDYIEATGTKIGDTGTEGTLLYHIHATMNLDDIESMSSRQASTILKMLKAKYARVKGEEKKGQ